MAYKIRLGEEERRKERGLNENVFIEMRRFERAVVGECGVLDVSKPLTSHFLNFPRSLSQPKPAIIS